MKNIYKIFGLAAVLGMVLSSCGDDFLDQEPIGQINPAVLQDAAGANAVLIGAYALLDGHERQGNYDARRAARAH